jgi:hypothetical protein
MAPPILIKLCCDNPSDFVGVLNTTDWPIYALNIGLKKNVFGALALRM